MYLPTASISLIEDALNIQCDNNIWFNSISNSKKFEWKFISIAWQIKPK